METWLQRKNVLGPRFLLRQVLLYIVITRTNCMKQSPSSETDTQSAGQKILYLSSLPFLQEPTTGPYPEHDESKKCTVFRDTMLCSLTCTASIFRADK
jgi:hypothetical protein